nr:MAG TPA: hypothetical protein [Caudoviricetes sp.]
MSLISHGNQNTMLLTALSIMLFDITEWIF